MRFTSRLVILPLLLLALGACSKQSESPGEEAGAVDEGDGSTAACTSIGGTCVTSLAPDCPLLQQNPTLCGNVVLVCCLPAGSDAAGFEEGEDAGADGAAGNPTPDGGTVSDATATADAAVVHDATVD
jgi:hypothetical protein